MITENTSLKPSSDKELSYKVIVKFESGAKQEKLQRALDYCRATFGHRGRVSGWWWKPKKTFKEGIFVFSFRKEEDALAFKLVKG
jgi:hypothetical protein